MKNIIKVKNGDDVVVINYDCLRQYHQDTNYAMLAITFKGLQGALKMFQNGILQRKNIKILSAHPGTGVRDAFEFVTRVVTNNAFTLDCTLPYATYNPHKQMGYYFEISNGNNTVNLTLKEGVLMPEFFEFFEKLQNKTATKKEINKFTDLKKSIEKKVLKKSPDKIFEFEVK
ncbi:MAG: hypothetical protein M0P43_09260 [Arcobacteraceae bacterium]|nr:hypothetical protein [Arcobacteraceae bacterium]